ncbi:MAG: hypothetical protein WKF61_07170 [Luteimonas sp.]
MYYVFFKTAGLVAILASVSNVVFASGWNYAPRKLALNPSRSKQVLHLQVDSQRRGLAVRRSGPASAVVDVIGPDGKVGKQLQIDGNIEGILVNDARDIAALHVKESGNRGAMTVWYVSTRGSAWPLHEVNSRYIVLDVLSDGRQLLADKLANGIALELRSADGSHEGRLVLSGERLATEGGDAGPDLARFALLRDGSGVVQLGTSFVAKGVKYTPLTTRLWDGRSAITRIAGSIRTFKGFDPTHLYLLTDDDRLWVTAAGSKPQAVDLHGQTVRKLEWTGDGGLKMLHGNASFVAETKMKADGRATAQWVRPRTSLATGLQDSVMGKPLEKMARADALDGQTQWFGQLRTSYLSDAALPDAAIVIAFDGSNDFAPRAYAWPDAAAYSPDMRWLLTAKAAGGYAIASAHPLAEDAALAILKKLTP